jgi:hypothetical protein
MWLLAVGVGMVFGKTIIHGILLSRFLRLKMFRADQVNHTIKVHSCSYLIAVDFPLKIVISEEFFNSNFLGEKYKI